ncbi:TPM domain-containing protein [Bifidobacterium pullorum]|uniref:TPM domain-containing protein n=1 Tax=Bifidobacterium pullorum TaxID=78448 RepID=UPI001EF5359C|nr:TPM domain-containing protein [Bifidobacterium pullorum]
MARLLGMLLACALAMWAAPCALADGDGGDAAPAEPGAAATTLTDDVTDTENLLGASASKVTDAIERTDRETGAHVKLVFVDSFNAEHGQKPEDWASQLLESTKPQPNTVMLAVASGDGNLVVVVSSNSDEWLRDRGTVDALSEAAAEPLTDGGQDWAGSALAMMEQLRQAKRTATSTRLSTAGVVAMGASLAALVVIAAVMVVVRRRREVAADAKREEESDAPDRSLN